MLAGFDKVQKGEKYSRQKMYTQLMPLSPKSDWKSISLQHGVHPRFKFIFWLVVHIRFVTVERLEKIDIQVHPDYIFRGGAKENFSHLFFEC